MENNLQDIVLSSRIRIARNVNDLPFPYKLSPEKAGTLIKDVYSSLGNDGNFSVYRMSDISAVRGNVLKEKHLISEDLLKSKEGGAALINSDETISIMVNEEDHIRQQCILPGLQFKEAYKKINAIDDTISKKIPFAYDDKIGYLTACPTNLGTGMRASAMMFLPGLSIYNSLEAAVNAIARLNMTIRGVYGEGSESAGYIFQVSNQKTLGLTENEIIDAVEASVGHIINAEIKARDTLMQKEEIELKDRILRAYGVLMNAYKIGSSEFMQLMAFVKLGAYYGLIKIHDKERFDRLFQNVQPASLASMAGRDLLASDRDIVRAQIVSDTLKEITSR